MAPLTHASGAFFYWNVLKIELGERPFRTRNASNTARGSRHFTVAHPVFRHFAVVSRFATGHFATVLGVSERGSEQHGGQQNLGNANGELVLSRLR